MDENIIVKAQEYATEKHNAVNQMYGDMPYTVHLQDVYKWGLRFRYLVRPEIADDVLAACWCHDIIEDARETYNDVKNELNENIAEIVYAVTNEKGKTRKERANDKYYAGIVACPGAVFVKMCDRLANVSMASGSMRQMYRKEHPHFVEKLFDPEYQEMFDELETQLSSLPHQRNTL